MPSDYRYRNTGSFSSNSGKKLDLKNGCLIPFILFVIVVGLIVGFSVLFGSE